MATPNWLTEDYIKEILKLHYQNSIIEILKIEIKPALGKGENFGGVLTKIFVKFNLKPSNETKVKHLLVKNSYEDDEFAKEKMKDYDIFNREMKIYDQVIPKLNRLLKEINDSDRLFGTVLYTDYKRQALILDDLTTEGYTMADRISRLDIDHVHLILRKLAKMHATSAVLNERKRNCLESYDRGFFNKYTNEYSTYFVGTFMAAAKYLEKDPELQYYANKMFALEPHYMNIGRRCFTPTPGQVNVLCHGDVWTNNVMFKYDPNTGKPIDVLLIDFQYSFWGSPTLDLHHFFNTSIKEPLRRFHQTELYQYYHHYFTDTLRKLSYSLNEIPNLKEFISQADERAFFAVHCAVVVQAVMINQDSRDADFNSLMNEDERALNFKQRLYNNPVIQENLRYLLPIFDQRGLLEIDQA